MLPFVKIIIESSQFDLTVVKVTITISASKHKIRNIDYELSDY